MRRFRIRRRRALAIALVPAAALTIGTSGVATGDAPRQAAIDPAKSSVRFGDRVTLRGQFPGAPGQAVAILHRRANGERFQRVATTRTDRNARWRARVKPRGTGMWRARLGSAPRTTAPDGALLDESVAADPETGAKRVRVRSITRVHAKNHALVDDRVRIRGRVKPGGSRKVVVKAGGKEMKTRSDGRGRFDVSGTCDRPARSRCAPAPGATRGRAEAGPGAVA